MESFQSTKSWLSKRWKKKDRNTSGDSPAKNLDLNGHYEDENKNDTTMIGTMKVEEDGVFEETKELPR